MPRARALVLAVLATTAFGSVALAGANPPRPPSEDPVVELGRRLFFDPAASLLGVRSCADCHDPEHGWSDVRPHSEDARGSTLRHSQSLIDCADQTRLHSDGEFKSIEDLIQSRLKRTPATGYFGEEDEDRRPFPRPRDADGISPDFEAELPCISQMWCLTSIRARSSLASATDDSVPAPVDALMAGGRYREMLGDTRASYGRLDASRMVAAIAAFCRSIRSGTSPYDRFAAGDADALSESAARGLALFQGRAGCVSCHRMEGKRPTFTDGEFHSTGVERRRTAGNCRTVDEGARTHRLGSTASFRTPTLRDVARRAPFMHDGSFATLEQAIAHYATPLPSEPGPPLDPRMPTAKLTEANIVDLAEFLRALTSDEAPGKSRVLWSGRAARTKVHIVDADGKPLPNREVTLVPAGGALPGSPPPREIRLRTDRAGVVEYAPPATTHVRLLLAEGMRPKGGTWIPDTCSETTIALPTRGTARLRVIFPPGEKPPALLVFQHDRAEFFPDHKLPTTTLVLESQFPAYDDRLSAFYRAPLRTDVPLQGRLRVPSSAPGWFPDFTPGWATLHYLTLGNEAPVLVGAP